MSSKNVEEYQFIEKLKHFPFVDAIILYGSRARGDQQGRSDIDLAIDCPKATEKEWLQVLEILDEADTLLKIDCVALHKLDASSPLRASILRDGKWLFKRNKMISVQIQDSYIKLKKALDALKVMVNKPVDPERAVIDATIQRFEFTIELFWKLLKRLIEEKGGQVTYPKEVLQQAYAGRLIDNEDLWLMMLADRNKTSHIYEEALADEIYKRITSDYYPLMKNTFDSFPKQLPEVLFEL